MAQLTKEFWFSSGTEGWTAEPLAGAGQNVSMGWFRKKGKHVAARPLAPIAKLKGSLRTTVKDDSPAGGGGLWRYVTSWEALGVPAGWRVWRASGSFLARWEAARTGLGGTSGRGPVANKLYFAGSNYPCGPLSVRNHSDQFNIGDLSISTAPRDRVALDEWDAHPATGISDPVSLTPPSWSLAPPSPAQILTGYGDSAHAVDLVLPSSLPPTDPFDDSNVFAYFLRLKQNGVTLTLDYSLRETLTPTTVGTNNSWALGAGPDKVTAVLPPDDDSASFISASTSASQDYNLSNPAIVAPGDDVDMVRVRVRASRGGGTSTILQVKLTDSTGTQGQAATLTSPWQTFEFDYEFMADGVTPWSKAEVDNLVVELARGSGTCRVSTVEVDVFFTPNGAAVVDSGAAADSSSIAAASTGTDAGAATEAHAVAASASGAEAGAGVEGATLAAASTGTEAAGGADAHTLAATSSGADSGLGADAHALAAQAAGADAGAATEASQLLVAITVGDSGAALDGLLLAATLTAPDSGAAAEGAASVAFIPAAEGGTGLEAFGLFASLFAAEVAAGGEGMALTASILALEGGIGAEAASVSLSVTDAATAADAHARRDSTRRGRAYVTTGGSTTATVTNSGGTKARIV